MTGRSAAAISSPALLSDKATGMRLPGRGCSFSANGLRSPNRGRLGPSEHPATLAAHAKAAAQIMLPPDSLINRDPYFAFAGAVPVPFASASVKTFSISCTRSIIEGGVP